MASSVIGALRVVLGIDSAQFETGLQRANRANKSFTKSTFEVSTAVRGMAAALGIVSVGATARGFLSLADQSKQLTAQLRLATNASGSFAQAQADVRRIAGETRTGLAETAQLYATFQRNSRELGITQEESARATETITKAFKISGATAAEAAGGLRQFLQGIQSGTLRGEELNSVLENAPRLARALADGLGVTIGQLREMGQEGKLTGREVLDALAGAAEGIDSEFEQMPKTFDEAMTTLHNAAVITFGGFDSGGQFSTALANFITQGTGGFAELERDAIDLGIDIRSTMAGLYDVFNPMLEGARSAFGEIGDEAKTLADRIRPLLGEIDAISNWASQQGLIGRLATGGSVSDWWNERPNAGGTNLLGDFNRAQQESARRLTGARLANDQANNIADQFKMQGVSSSGAPSRPASNSAGGKGGGKGGGRKGPSEETLRKRAQRELELAENNLRRFLDDLAQSQADLVSSSAELSRDLERRAEAEKGQIEADRVRRERAIKADDDLDDAKKQQLLTLNDQEAENRKALVTQRLYDDVIREGAQIAQDRADLEIEFLGYSRDLARTATARRDIELRILDLAFEAEKAQLESIKATNAVTSAEYARADALLRSLPERQGLARRITTERTQGPLESYLSSLPRTAEEVNEALEGVASGGIQSIVDGLAEAMTGARSLGSVFKNVARDIIADLIRIQIRKAIVSGLSSVLGGLGIGGGAAGGGEISTKFGVGGLPKFATGGSFRVGGPPGIDNTLVAFKASRGEMVDIRRPGNDNGGGGAYFDLRGAVMTADLLAQMNKIGQSSGMGGAMAGANLAENRMMQRSRRRIPG